MARRWATASMLVMPAGSVSSSTALTRSRILACESRSQSRLLRAGSNAAHMAMFSVKKGRCASCAENAI